MRDLQLEKTIIGEDTMQWMECYLPGSMELDDCTGYELMLLMIEFIKHLIDLEIKSENESIARYMKQGDNPVAKQLSVACVDRIAGMLKIKKVIDEL